MLKKNLSVNFKKYIYKKFSIGWFYTGGRNNLGRITVRHRGNKSIPRRKYVCIDYKHSVRNLKFILLQIRVSPRRNSFISLILYENVYFHMFYRVKILKLELFGVQIY